MALGDYDSALYVTHDQFFFFCFSFLFLCVAFEQKEGVVKRKQRQATTVHLPDSEIASIAKTVLSLYSCYPLLFASLWTLRYSSALAVCIPSKMHLPFAFSVGWVHGREGSSPLGG